MSWEPLAKLSKLADEEVASGSVLGATVQANTRAVQAVISSVESAKATAKEMYDATPQPVKATAEHVAENINSFAAAAGKAAKAVTKKATEAAEAAKPTLEKAASDVAAVSADAAGKAAKAVAN